MSSHPEELQRQQMGSSKKVAFFAVVDKQRLGCVSPNQILRFEKAITNVGDAYNTAHGIFTAPVSGLYQFNATIMADNDAEVWAFFTLNNEHVSNIYARATGGRHDQGSQTIILQLNKGCWGYGQGR